MKKYEFEMGWLFGAALATFLDWLMPVGHWWDALVILVVLALTFFGFNKVFGDD